MSEESLTRALGAVAALRESKELAFAITRTSTTVSVVNGPTVAALLADGLNPDDLTWAINVIPPIILAMAADNQPLVLDSVNKAKQSISERFHIEISDEWLISKISPLVSESLRTANLHRSASFGNLYLGLAANKLYRENRNTLKKFPFFQIRIDYADNSSSASGTSSFELEMYEAEIIALRDGLNSLLDLLGDTKSNGE